MYELHALTSDDVEVVLRRAMAEGGAGERGVDDEALRFLATRAGGDARTALQALELAAATAGEGEPVTLALAEDALQRRAVRFDKRRRPALRHDLGLDQGDARVRSRRRRCTTSP